MQNNQNLHGMKRQNLASHWIEIGMDYIFIIHIVLFKLSMV